MTDDNTPHDTDEKRLEQPTPVTPGPSAALETQIEILQDELERTHRENAEQRKELYDEIERLESQIEKGERAFGMTRALLKMGGLSTKQQRKGLILDECVQRCQDRAAKGEPAKTALSTGDIADLVDVTERTARTYRDEIAEEVPGCKMRRSSSAFEADKLLFDLEAFNALE